MSNDNIEEILRELASKGEAAHFNADGHWDIFLKNDGTCSYSYYCCDYEECCSSYYDGYDSVEKLIEDNIDLLDFKWNRCE